MTDTPSSFTARARALPGEPWFGPLAALLVVYALFAVVAPDTFLGSLNLLSMVRATVVVGVTAVGMTLIMIQGGIDLSVGSVVALATVAIARSLQAGQSPMMALATGIAVGAIAGLANGALVAGLRLTPFIATLGTMSALRGLAKGLAREQKIDAEPGWLEELMTMPPPERTYQLLPIGVWVGLLLAIVAAFVLARSRFGRHVVATGSSPATARLCGIDVGRVTILVYVLGGLLAGVAGVLEFSTLTVGDPTDSVGLELKVIAAVVIGGGSLSGGQGSIAGTLLGALLLTFIDTGCTHVGLPNWVQEILTGAIIVVAVWLDRLRRRDG
ncbi:MAG: ABC transporter permease [Polyangiaceae bacterium]|nr:ABC transporter permease [Polyangiaceae bacterium]